MRTGKRLAGAMVAASVSLLVISACGGGGSSDTGKSVSAGFADCKTKPNDCNSGATKPGGTFTYTVEKKITGWNLNDAETNTADFVPVLAGILPAAFVVNPDFSVTLNGDLLASAEQTSTSPQTIVYKIKPEAVWDDNTPITADDFIYAWQTRNGKDCKDCSPASTSGYEIMKSVTGSDNGKTVTVVYDSPFLDWKSVFDNLQPAHLAKQHGDLATSWKWLNETQPAFSGGPYKISDFQKDVSVTEVPNPKWYGKTKPSLEKLVFRIITDQAQQVPALQNNEVQSIYPQPDPDIVTQVKGLAPNVQYNLGTGLTWEHLDFNLKNKFLADKALRQAIFTAVDRKAVIAKTVGQFMPDLKPLDSHNFMPGTAGYKDVISSTGAGAGDVEKAKKVLTDAGYKDVGTALKTPAGDPISLRISYTSGNTLRKATSELFQDVMQKSLGLKVDVVAIQSLGKTLTSGDYDVMLFAWVGNPFPFQGAQQLWGSTSDSNYGKWVNAQSDALLKQASGELDPKKATDLLNQADQVMANDYYVLPLFQKPTFLAVYSQFANIRDNATSSSPGYNVQEWGLRASAK
jgi:peptide/nickel transport system substrate-binding protein